MKLQTFSPRSQHHSIDDLRPTSCLSRWSTPSQNSRTRQGKCLLKLELSFETLRHFGGFWSILIIDASIDSHLTHAGAGADAAGAGWDAAPGPGAIHFSAEELSRWILAVDFAVTHLLLQVIMYLQSRVVLSVPQWPFFLVLSPVRNESVSQAGAEACDPWNSSSTGVVERFQWNFTESEFLPAEKTGNVNLPRQSLLGLGHF